MKHEAHETTAEAAEYHVRNPRASPKRTKLRLYTRLFYSFNFNPARRDLHIRYIMHHSQELVSLRSDDVCRSLRSYCQIRTWHVNVPIKVIALKLAQRSLCMSRWPETVSESQRDRGPSRILSCLLSRSGINEMSVIFSPCSS